MAFLDRHTARPLVDPGLEWRFLEGNLIGQLARETLGPGRQLALLGETAITQSAEALASQEPLYEVTMEAGGLIARADALLPVRYEWELVEVKSSKLAEDGTVKAEHIDDAAFTLMVAQMAGVPVARVSLMLLSPLFRKAGDHSLFSRVDVTELVRARANEFGGIVTTVAESLRGVNQPTPSLQLACKACDHFSSRCIGTGIDDSILRLPRLNDKTLRQLQPHARISALPDAVTLTAAQQRVVQLVKSRGVERDRTALAKLDHVLWPVHYLDFEAVMPAVPWFDGDAPYTTIPFQFSVHSLERAGAEPRHAEYLASPEEDWRRDLTVRLIEALNGDGSILVYSPYERTQINGLAASFPDLAPSLARIVSRLFDLEPFFRTGLVHHRFAGSSSIKKVLPVLVPDLSYDQLSVGNGTAAAAVFSLMKVGAYPHEECASMRAALLEYCGLDTMAMVRLHRALLSELNELRA